jgi:hypothetical protein
MELLMHSVAVIIDGVWQQLPVSDGHNAIDAKRDTHNVINSSHSILTVDDVVAALAKIIVQTQTFSKEEQGRVREFLRIAHATLSATTCLPIGDQRLFEAHLRNAAARNG